jgi:uncharacterized membrane protein HdeD (DUF308 family)
MVKKWININEKQKMVLIGILLVILSISVFIVGPATLNTLTGTSALIVNANGVFQFIYKYWKVEDVAVFIIGIICIIVGLE